MRKNIFAKAILAMLILAVAFSADLILPEGSYAASRPAKVIQKRAVSGVDYVTLKWKKVKKAKGYQVYMYNSKRKKYVWLKTINDNGVTAYTARNLKPSTNYKFKVRAFREYTQYYHSKKHKWVSKRPLPIFVQRTRLAQKSGRFSAVKKIKTKKLALTKPSINVYSPGYRRMDVRWKALAGVRGYYVKEYDSSGKLISTRTVAAGSDPCALYYDKKVNSTWSYTVQAYAVLNGKTCTGPVSDKRSASARKTRIGQAAGDEHWNTTGGKAGDQTGSEVATSNWSYSSKKGSYNNWRVIVRFKNATLANRAATAMEAACANNHIGYDQKPAGGRGELRLLAQKANWDMSKITKNCEVSCSPLVGACVNCAGITPAFTGGNKAPGSTGNSDFLNPLMATGYFVKITDSKTLTTEIYLQRGDILISPGRHTAMVL
ncbi:MAG: fibronectin type III domain-containing protein [Firmicutes bacterium]|nr:fibronectin type III domain-containing protein [Bacillota bacterium]